MAYAHLRGFLPSEDCMHTVNALCALWDQDRTTRAGHANRAWEKACAYAAKKAKSIAAIPARRCGFSLGCLPGRHLRAGLWAMLGSPKRPMDRVIAPLRQMGANILAEGPGRDVTTPYRWRLLAWNSLSSARCECAGKECVAAGGPLCQGQDHCRGARHRLEIIWR